MKIQFAEIVGSSDSAELILRAGSPNDAAALFTIYQYLRDYKGDLRLRTPGSGTFDIGITL